MIFYRQPPPPMITAALSTPGAIVLALLVITLILWLLLRKPALSLQDALKQAHPDAQLRSGEAFFNPNSTPPALKEKENDTVILNPPSS